MPPKTRIRGAQVVLPSEIAQVDVIIEGHTIAAIDPAPQIATEQVIEAQGLHLLPGVVDDQVHFREPGLTHKEELATATRACAKGGVTTFLEMPNTKPETVTVERLHDKLSLAAERSLVNYGFYMGATPDNVEQLQRAKRTPGIKIFIGSSTGDLLVDDQDALERIFAETTLPITAHCEDETTIRNNRAGLGDELTVHDHMRIRDHDAARIATERALDLAKRHDHRFHLLHVSTAIECEIMATRPKGITAEACIHHLLFSAADYDHLGTRLQANPSVKTEADRKRLWAALAMDDLQVVATDHAPHTLEEKSQPYPKSPSGVPAIENSLALMLDQVHRGACTLQQVAHWMSDAPARVWDMVGKGRIEQGYDADLVLVDLHQKHTVRDEDQLTKCGWSPWHGQELVGLPVQTIVGGKTVYNRGQLDTAFRGREVAFDHDLGGYWATA